jgi:nucleotide-binding universal stress UspA family protein
LPRQIARRVELGDPAERLASTARDEDATLVVVGSPRSAPPRSALLGGVSRRLVRSCDRPVVIVPRGAAVPGDGRAVESLICGVDDSEGSDRAVAAAAALAAELGLGLVIAHVYAPFPSAASIPASSGALPVDAERLEERARRRAIELLDRAEQAVSGKLSVRRRLASGDPASCLAVLAAHERAAIVVVGSRGHGAGKTALLGSVASAVVGSAAIPIAIVTHEVERVPRTSAAAESRPGARSSAVRRVKSHDVA